MCLNSPIRVPSVKFDGGRGESRTLRENCFFVCVGCFSKLETRIQLIRPTWSPQNISESQIQPTPYLPKHVWKVLYGSQSSTLLVAVVNFEPLDENNIWPIPWKYIRSNQGPCNFEQPDLREIFPSLSPSRQLTYLISSRRSYQGPSLWLRR